MPVLGPFIKAHPVQNSNDANTTEQQVTVTGVRPGDLLICLGTIDNVEVPGNPTFIGGRFDGQDAEWTLFRDSTTINVNAQPTTYLWWKYATYKDYGDTTYQFAWAGIEMSVGCVLHIRGDDGLDVHDLAMYDSVSSARTLTPNSPSVNTTGDNTLNIYVLAADDTNPGTLAVTPPTGPNHLFTNRSSTGSAGGVVMSVAWEIQASAGASGAKQWEIDSLRDSAAATIAIKLGEGERDYGEGSGARQVQVDVKASKVPGTGGALERVRAAITEALFDGVRAEIIDADGGDAALNGGGDVRIYSDANGRERVAIDIRRFVTDNDPANAKVEIRLDPGPDGYDQDSATPLYIRYKVAGKTQPAAAARWGSQSVYEPGTMFMFHMDDDPTDGSPDATAYAQNAIQVGSMTIADLVEDGYVGRGFDLEGSNDGLQIETMNPVFPAGSFAIRATVKLDNKTTGFPSMAGIKQADGGDNPGFWFDYQGSTKIFRFVVKNTSGSTFGATSDVAFTVGQKYDVVGVYNDSDKSVKMFVDGVLQSASATLTGTRFTAQARFHIGHNRVGTVNVDNLDGIEDEVFLLDWAPSADEVALIYNAEVDPEDFFDHTYTPAEVGAGPAVLVTPDTLGHGSELADVQASYAATIYTAGPAAIEHGGEIADIEAAFAAPAVFTAGPEAIEHGSELADLAATLDLVIVAAAVAIEHGGEISDVAASFSETVFTASPDGSGHGHELAAVAAAFIADLVAGPAAIEHGGEVASIEALYVPPIAYVAAGEVLGHGHALADIMAQYSELLPVADPCYVRETRIHYVTRCTCDACSS